MQNTSAFIFDQTVSKTKYLHQALCETNAIIQKLEEENNRLKDVLANLASENNEGYILTSETFNEPMFAS